MEQYNYWGQIIKEISKDNEITNNFIVSGDDTIAFMYSDVTILSNSNKSKVFNNQNPNYNLSKSGYLSELETFYSLINVGKSYDSKDYINIVRFASYNKTYDVIIPYYLDNISYDLTTNNIICIVNDSESYKYILLKFDESIQEYVLDPQLYSVEFAMDSYYDPSTDSYCKYTLAKNNKLYMVSTVETEYYLNKSDTNLESTHANLILTIIDIENKSVRNIILKHNYPVSEQTKFGLIFGSNDLPMTIVNDKLYVFTSDYDVLIIENENNIQIIEMPYIFTDAISKWSPKEPNYYQNNKNFNNFFGSVIRVGDDGEIYILNLYSDDIFKIYKLLEDGEYEMVFQGELPENLHGDLILNTFLLIN